MRQADVLRCGKNESYESRRVCVSAHIEGLSARVIKTIELGQVKNVGESINLLPTLIPEQARRITEVQRCPMHVEVVDPATGRPRDLTKYYGA